MTMTFDEMKHLLVSGAELSDEQLKDILTLAVLLTPEQEIEIDNAIDAAGQRQHLEQYEFRVAALMSRRSTW